MLLILYTTIVIFFFVHISDVLKIAKSFFTILSPILYGLVIAYLLNYPYKLFHDHAFKKMGTKRKWLKKLKKPLSLLLTYALIISIIVFLVVALIPDLSTNVKTFVDSLPQYRDAVIKASDNAVEFIAKHTGYNLYEYATYNNVMSMITGSDTTAFIKRIATEIVPSAFSTLLGIGAGLYNWIIGIIISIYLLASKERLIRQLKTVILAYTPEKVHRRVFKIADVFNNKCGRFIVGKIIDSAIIGVMCFIGLTIFRFHYPLLISVIIGVFNMIPFFGPIIGAIPTTLLLLLNNPMEALGFVVFIIVLQQFDGNILGPKILGESVGISGFWIMVSVILGGGLFGVPGMLLGVPVFAAIYTLVQEGADRRLKQKNITVTAEGPDAEADALQEDAPQEDASQEGEKPQKEHHFVEKLHDLLNKGKNK